MVYPACAGIDLTEDHPDRKYFSLPRMRGDRPLSPVGHLTARLFTPHARGSTSFLTLINLLFLVYPACAGIDLGEYPDVEGYLRLPRMRGDRPFPLSPIAGLCRFTPHARGSTLPLVVSVLIVAVYPACAGIDLAVPTFSGQAGGLPRMRGDRPVRQIS